MRIMRMDVRDARLEWLEKESMFVGVAAEMYNVRAENDEEELVLRRVTECAVDAGIEVWRLVTGAKSVHRIGEDLATRHEVILFFEARGSEQMSKMTELLKELVVKRKREE